MEINITSITILSIFLEKAPVTLSTAYIPSNSAISILVRVSKCNDLTVSLWSMPKNRTARISWSAF